MGLLARFSVTADLGYAPYTTYYHWPIDYDEGCEVFVNTFLASARGSVPVDTGALKGSIDANTNGEEVECVAEEDYAQYVEFGTIKMEAQPYFEPAIEEAYAAANPLWKEAEQEAQEADHQAYLQEMQAAQRAGGIGGIFGGAGGGGGFFGNLLGGILAAIILGFFNILNDILFGDHSNRGFSDGSSFASAAGGKINIEIT